LCRQYLEISFVALCSQSLSAAKRLLCEAVSSPPEETGLGSQKSIENTPCQRKNEGGAKKDLQIYGAGRKSRHEKGPRWPWA
jgi:hypothetical protein